MHRRERSSEVYPVISIKLRCHPDLTGSESSTFDRPSIAISTIIRARTGIERPVAKESAGKRSDTHLDVYSGTVAIIISIQIIGTGKSFVDGTITVIVE